MLFQDFFCMFAVILSKKYNMNNNLKGFAYGIATSVTFGLIPLFTLPLMEKGMRFDSILFYRFLFAAIALSGMLLAKKESFRTEMRNLPILILLGAFLYRLGNVPVLGL